MNLQIAGQSRIRMAGEIYTKGRGTENKSNENTPDSRGTERNHKIKIGAGCLKRGQK
jgi:hypothetical protein